MGPVRRAVNLVLALALTILSATAFIWLIFFAPTFSFWMPIDANDKPLVFVASSLIGSKVFHLAVC
jgi:hypothetical protein